MSIIDRLAKDAIMKSYKLLLVPVILSVLLFSCKKQDEGEHNTVTQGGYSSLVDVYNKVAPKPTTVSMSISQGASIFSPRGTRFIIPINAFETQAGVKVNGSVQITVNDWLLKGDMTFGKVLPTTYDTPLNTAGEAYISAMQNGEVLRLRQGVRVQVNFPQFNNTINGTMGYIGDATLQGSQNIVNWLPVDSNTIKLEPAPNADTVTIYSTTLGYLSASAPFTAPNAMPRDKSFKIRLNSPVTLENTMAVGLYDGSKTVVGIPSAINGEILAMGYSGAHTHFAVMGIKSGIFYGGIVDVPNPMSDSTYTVIIKQIEPPTFKIQLNSL
jgi:hypothetical protein